MAKTVSVMSSGALAGIFRDKASCVLQKMSNSKAVWWKLRDTFGEKGAGLRASKLQSS
jgi:hypothetical protein